MLNILNIIIIILFKLCVINELDRSELSEHDLPMLAGVHMSTHNINPCFKTQISKLSHIPNVSRVVLKIVSVNH